MTLTTPAFASLIILTVTLILVTVFLVRFSWRLSKIIFQIEEQVEESLDILDAKFGELTKIAGTPVMSDDPQIRKMLHALREARAAVLVVANKLVSFSTTKQVKK